MKAIFEIGRRLVGRGKKPRNPHGYTLSAGQLMLVFALSGAGCASAPPRATQEVKIPVAIPCIKAPPVRPAFEFPVQSPNATDGDKILAMARDTLLHFKYEGQLEAAIAGCL